MTLICFIPLQKKFFFVSVWPELLVYKEKKKKKFKLETHIEDFIFFSINLSEILFKS